MFFTEYEMTENGISHKLQVSREEKDLGIYIADNLKPGLQCAKAASKAMSVLGMIRRRFGKIDRESFHCCINPMFDRTCSIVCRLGHHIW